MRILTDLSDCVFLYVKIMKLTGLTDIAFTIIKLNDSGLTVFVEGSMPGEARVLE